MDTEGLIKYLGSVAFIVAAAGFFARSIVGLVITKRTELYKADRTREIETHKADLTRQLESYKADLAQNLEAHKSKLQLEKDHALELLRNMGTTQVEKLKAELQHQNNEALEKLRHDLRPIAYAAEVRAAELNKRRAEVIAETYKLLAITQDAFRDYMKLVENSNEKPHEERAKTAGDAGKNFVEYYDQHKVFLPADVCQLLDDMVKKLTDAWFGYTFWGYGPPTGKSPYDEIKYEGQKEGVEAIRNDIPAARAELEAALRELLGDTATKEPTDAR